MTPYVMRAAFRTNAPDKHLEFYRTVQDILHNKSMTEIEQLNRIRMMAGAAACGPSYFRLVRSFSGTPIRPATAWTRPRDRSLCFPSPAEAAPERPEGKAPG